MTIQHDLAHHCIETAIRCRRNAAISRYFKSHDHKNDLEDGIELLGNALRDFDFNRLRSRYSPLAGHDDVIVMLTLGAANQPTLVFDDIAIVPPARPAGRVPIWK